MPGMRALCSPPLLGVTAAAVLLLSACKPSAPPTDNPSKPGATAVTTPLSADGGDSSQGRVFVIQPGPDATEKMVQAMVQMRPGDVLEFGCGYFELKTSLQLAHTEDVRVRGCGKDRTVLSFKQSDTPVGIMAENVSGVVIEHVTVLDTGGNGVELRGVHHGTVRHVRTLWSSGGGKSSPDPITAENAFLDNARRLNVKCENPVTRDPEAPENTPQPPTQGAPGYVVSPKSGRYGVYPVSSEHILVEHTESIGASDAGIYVGQTNNAIIRNSRAAYNVFGFEIENVQGGEYAHNLAECNTGGFLIYDLDNLRQYGDRSRMYGNTSRNNNTYNFTAGGIVGKVPAGSGMITLSYDRIDVFDNVFESNNTAGIIHTSYALFPKGDRPTDNRIDWYTEGLRIYRNTFKNNGNNLPKPTSKDLLSQDVAKFLPALVGLKNQAGCLRPENLEQCARLNGLTYRGAHILWDGMLEDYDPSCPYPKRADGSPVPPDARGKPLHTNEDPNPSCHYNAYKFDLEKPGQPRKKPEWFASCIDADNTFSDDSLRYANFHGTRGLELVTEGEPTPSTFALFPASFDASVHECQKQYGKNLEPLPAVVIPPFVRSGSFDPAPSEERIAELCNKPTSNGQVNFEAAPVNCPRLDQYHLFRDPEDPTSAPNGDGVPFVLNSKLFSDYAVKYRVLYLPPNTKATYRDAGGQGGGLNPNATLDFPVGTVLAKTFAFVDGDTRKVVETRLLIKRVTSHGIKRWDGLTYVWGTDATGRRVAHLSPTGGTAQVQWNFKDVDSGRNVTGQTANYLIPNANQCLSCHANTDKEPGSAPIGTKVRFLNRPYAPESSIASEQGGHPVLGKNQLQYWCEQGKLAGCPSAEVMDVNPVTKVARGLERIPTYNKPGDSGHPAGSAADIEARARAWLEVNCQHCHNVRGQAASTGFYLDSLRPVNESYGICKRPIATGHDGSNGRPVDLFPTGVDKSIVEFRIGPEARTPAARMPPLARSVVDEEAHALIRQWIRDVLVLDEEKYPGSKRCSEMQ